MTEFETTSLTLQAAAIATSTLIGLGQIAVIWYFGRQMVRANRDRAQDNQRLEQDRAQDNQRLEQENQRRHEETMTSLQALIRGMDRQWQALERQGQALERQGQALAAMGQALDRQGRGLETLIARQGG